MPERGRLVNRGNRPPRGNGEGVASPSPLPTQLDALVMGQWTPMGRPGSNGDEQPIMNKRMISTDQAPRAIGTYSQAVRVGETLYLSGQIPLVPETMELVPGDVQAQLRRVFDNLAAVAAAAGGSLADLVKLTVFLTNLEDFPLVNQVMAEYFRAPYPARAVVGVSALPKGAAVELDAILVLAGP